MKTISSKKNLGLIIVSVAVLALLGCARNEPVDQCLTGHTYGFLGGLWHGFIAPFDFIGMLFNKDITMYAQNNNGGLYALGFLIGSGGWGFFSSKGATKMRTGSVRFQSRRFDEAEIID
ncbi:MAG TPA: hypothetical protein VJ963_08900 [Bacteroidales bacterium]|nr:hypothetical protein [Bacteroidales bacterium]